MSFQNLPWLWATIALIALPVVIHLINQYRHRTVKWAAMMFLLDAKRMTSGMARLRQVLILVARTLAVAGLIFAVARPLASGWLGLAAGGAPETVIVLLDRSASMEQQNLTTGMSKRAAALEKLTEFLATTGLGSGTQLVLVESSENVAREIDSLEALRSLPETGATATTADIPAMMQTALEYTTTNQIGRTDVWLCSDLRGNDWDPGGGRWEALQTAFAEKEAVKFFLLSFDELASDNLAVSVDRVIRREVGDVAELVMDVRVSRAAATIAAPADGENVNAANDGGLAELSVPLAIVIDGARSVEEITLEEGQTEVVLQGHTIAIDRTIEKGWGRVELPGDSNPLDNVMTFVFAEPPVRVTTVVSDDDSAAGPLQAAAGAAIDPTIEYRAVVVAPDDASIAEVDWEASALLLWQGEVPTTDSTTGRQLEEFVAAGKSVIFFPPSGLAGGTGQNSEGEASVFGLNWGQWRDAADEGGAKINTWRRDSDLLADTQDGSALPMGELRIYRWREADYADDSIDPTVLARLAENASPVLERLPISSGDAESADAGGVYVCHVLPQASQSNLARDGVTLFAILHRALESGARSLAGANQRVCGRDALPADENWQAVKDSAIPGLSGASADSSTTERGLLPGVFFTETINSEGEKGRRLVALNRPLEEDSRSVVDGDDLATLFSGLDYERITLTVDDRRSLVSEVWRAFLIAMALALIIEAFLCLPKKKLLTPAEARAKAQAERDAALTQTEAGAAT
jgi:hypothetical protein